MFLNLTVTVTKPPLGTVIGIEVVEYETGRTSVAAVGDVVPTPPGNDFRLLNADAVPVLVTAETYPAYGYCAGVYDAGISGG